MKQRYARIDYQRINKEWSQIELSAPAYQGKYIVNCSYEYTIVAYFTRNIVEAHCNQTTPLAFTWHRKGKWGGVLFRFYYIETVYIFVIKYPPAYHLRTRPSCIRELSLIGRVLRRRFFSLISDLFIQNLMWRKIAWIFDWWQCKVPVKQYCLVTGSNCSRQ